MTFTRYFKLFIYGTIGAGFASIATTDTLGWIPIALFTAVLIVSGFINIRRSQPIISTRILNSLALAYLLFFLIDSTLLSHSLLLALIHFLLFLSALKLLNIANDRDYLLLFFISFAELLTASVLTADMVFLICFLIFLFFGAGSLILFEMRSSNARVQAEAKVQPFVENPKFQGTGLELFSPFPAGLFSIIAVGITLLILAGAIPLFFLLPRISTASHRQPSGKTQFISGFSKRVELGQIGSIKKSDTIVMRIKTDRTPSELSPDLKWRGLALDHYDGKSWSQSEEIRDLIPVEGRFYRLEDIAQGTDWIHQTFFMEALSTDVVFAAHKALAVSSDIGLLQRDATESLYTAPHRQNKLRYSVISDPIHPDPTHISDQDPIPSKILRTYLQLPANDSRIADLAEHVTKTVPKRFDKARAIEQYLRTHYTYSLTLRGMPNSKDPLAMFLFDVRAGHCEYFASAMTIMLRQIGIPARLVNGFRAGEYNRLGRNWIVRQYDAHSWVEAYFSPYGWIEFDPTPPDPRHSRSALMNLLANLTDTLSLGWWDGIVNYDSSKQFRVFNSLLDRTYSLQRSTRDLFANVYHRSKRMAEVLVQFSGSDSARLQWILWMVGIACAIVLLIKPARKRILGWTMRRLYRGNSPFLAASFYREALALLASHGLQRSREQTPMEFALSLSRHPAGESLLALTCLYNAARFGPPEEPFLHSETDSLLRLLRESLRRNRS
jgi:transglutaminase-like putative cysteine protease